jgi:hypothetical protein
LMFTKSLSPVRLVRFVFRTSSFLWISCFSNY